MKYLKKSISLFLAILFVLQLFPMKYFGILTVEAFAAEGSDIPNGYSFEIPSESENTVTAEIPQTFIDNREEPVASEDETIGSIGEGPKADIYGTTSTSDSEIDDSYYINSPYVYQNNVNEKVSLSSGAFVYENTDYVLPGRNGLDLVIARRYKSSEATLYKGMYCYNEYKERSVLHMYSNTRLSDLYTLGYGWEFAFTSIEILEETEILHLSDGRSYVLNETESSKLSLSGGSDSGIHVVKYPETVEELNAEATYTVTYIDGKTEYLDSKGKLMYIKDIFGNRIKFSYSTQNGINAITITDTLDRQTVISSAGTDTGHLVTVSLPDNNVLEYNVEYHESGLKAISSYKDAEANITNYSYTIDDLESNESSSEVNNCSMVLSTITHPTHAQTKFEYVIGSYLINRYHSGRIAMLTLRYDLIGENKYNVLSYSYPEEYIDLDSTGIVPHLGNFHISVTSETGLTTKTEFNSFGQMNRCTKSRGDIVYEKTEYGYAGLGSLPTSTTVYRYDETQNKTITFVTNTNYHYGRPKNVWSTYAEGDTDNTEYLTTYSYSGGLLQSSAYNMDSNTRVSLYNTVKDEKYITTSQVSVNDVVVQSSDYTYDSYGNMLTEKCWNADKTAYALTEYTYLNGIYLTQEKHSDISTSDGTTALGTSGNADGTVVFNYTYDTYGRLATSTDGNGNITSYAYDKLGNITKITNPDGTTVTYTRNYSGNYVIVKDENGAEIKYTYTPLGLEYETIDVSTGKVITHKEYDSSSRLVKVCEYIYGSVTEYTYDCLDRITSETVKQGDTILSQTLYSYEYAAEDGTYNKVTKTIVGDSNAPSVVTTEYTDKHGNVAKTGKIIGGTEYFDTYTYDYVGNCTSVLTAADAAKGLAYTTKYEYDHNGQVTKTYNANGQYTTNTYDAFGKLVSATDYAGTPTTYTYDTLGRLTSQTVTIEEGVTSTSKYEYDATGNIIREWSQNNAVGGTAEWAKTEYTYDNRNRLASVKQYDGENVAMTTAYTYDGVGNTLSMTSGGKTTTYTYDRFGNVLTETDALNKTETYTYGILGKLESKTDRNGVSTAYSYDALGRVLGVSASDGASTETQTYTYIKTGQVLTETNAGGSTAYTYDELGRVIKVEETVKTLSYPDVSAKPEPAPEPEPSPEPGSAHTVYFDAAGGSVSVPSITVEEGDVYDLPTPEKTGYTFGGWYCGETLIENGSAVSITEDSVFTAAWTANTYTVTFHNTTLYSLVKKATDTFTYDVEKALVCDAFTTKGNIALVGWSTTSGGEVVYECNQLVMNLTAEPNGNVDLYAVWEPIISTEEITEPETEASAFSLEEVTEETTEEPTETEEPVLVTTVYCKTYTYDIAGNRISFTLEKSGETVHNITYSYDNLNRLSTVSENGTVEASYTYDTNGNRKSVTYGNGTAEIYEYNLANWVTNLYNKKGNGGVISNYSYEYYVSGNQKSKTDNTGAVTTYSYDDLGRLTRESESDGTILSYAYDAAGNRARLTATGIESYVTDYTYDNANRLLTETKTVDGAEETTTYTYDANGNTLTVTSPESLQVNTYNLFNQLVTTNINGSSSAYTYNTAGIRTAKTVDKVTTVFLLDGGNVVGEVQNDTVKATYLCGANLISRESTTARQYYVFNAHGDVTALVGTDEAVYKRYDYDAFGSEKEPSENDYNPFRYCGEYFDKETGTYYLRARYYDPSIGRFTAIDPVKDGFNWYVYCSSNPVAFIDPLGLYNREAAAQYAQEHAFYYNHNYLAFDNILTKIYYALAYGVNLGYDCTNFTSQALYAGGISMNDEWHYYKVANELLFSYPIFYFDGSIYFLLYKTDDEYITWAPFSYDFTSVWSVAKKQFEFFSDPQNGYIEGDVIKLSHNDQMKEIVESGILQIGDLIYFENDEGIHHAAMITGFENGHILYSGHTFSAYDKQLNLENESVYIIRIKDDA